MNRRVTILSKKRVFEKAIFRIDEVTLQHETFFGTMSKPITRLNLDRGDSAAALIHNVDTNCILFTEQFRYPTYEKGPGWMLELPAGVLDKDEKPEQTMIRELVEEIGYRVPSLQFISTFYLSPGGTSERIWLFYGKVKNENIISVGGGLVEEGEDIRVVQIPVREAFDKMTTGEIVDAKTIIGLQWLYLQQIQHP